jgi:hypothetical protein
MKFITPIFLLVYLLLPQAKAEESVLEFPRTRLFEGGELIIHAPQVVSWTEFQNVKVQIAVEFSKGEAEPVYASVAMSGSTDLDMDGRLVTVSRPVIDQVLVEGESISEYADKLADAIRKDRIDVPLDIFLMSLAQDVIENAHNESLNPQPPSIFVAHSPTVLLLVSGEPVMEKISRSKLKRVINANWPLLVDQKKGKYYLLARQSWLRADALDGVWQRIEDRPEGLRKVSPEKYPELFVEPTEQAGDISVISVSKPAELIVIDGDVQLEAIAEAPGLQFAANTTSPVFLWESNFYYLAAGRWFMAQNFAAEWRTVTELPEVFSLIPADHGMGYVRSSVPGTLEARTALLEASLPQVRAVERKDKLRLKDAYEDKPRFEEIKGTKLRRAVNSPYDIFEYEDAYYLCYEAAWYVSSSAKGSWTPTADVPDEIYNMPVDSPAYRVASVEVKETTPTSVVYITTASYYSGIYPYYGFPVYGTGWYYPYYYYPYYPYYYPYGYGSYYNPVTGRYATRSVWYGPYGGYSYNEYANRRTGRYGYVETGWDYDDWVSYGESYNPRTNIYTETSRHFSDDHDRLETERRVVGEEKSMTTRRETDFDDRWSRVERATSEGDSMVVKRRREDDGSVTTEGDIDFSDGRSATIEGEIADGQRKTRVEGSEGGGLVSAGDGERRGTLARDREGNLYAGRNGDVYKRSDDTWYSYDRGEGWQAIEPERQKPDRPQEQVIRSKRDNNVERDGEVRRQLQRDARARNLGNRQFQQRQMQGRFGRSGLGGARGRLGGRR